MIEYWVKRYINNTSMKMHNHGIRCIKKKTHQNVKSLLQTWKIIFNFSTDMTLYFPFFACFQWTSITIVISNIYKNTFITVTQPILDAVMSTGLYLHTYSFHKYYWIPCYGAGTLLGFMNSTVKKGEVLYLSAHIPVGKVDNKQRNPGYLPEESVLTEK